MTDTIFLFLLPGISTAPAAVTHTQPVAHGNTISLVFTLLS